MKKLLIAIVVLGVWSLLSVTAEAVCDRTFVHVVRVTTQPGTALSYIFYRDNALTNYYWMCTTTDAKLVDAALAAQNGLTRALIRGDAASCPAVPAAGGQVSAGTCLLVVVNP